MNTSDVELLKLECTGYSGAVERTCYLRTRVLGSDDSLVSISPTNTTGMGTPLLSGDSCLVWDIFNRVFIFRFKEGLHTNNPPSIVSVTNSSYWELQKIYTSNKIKIEKYQISSILFGSNYLLTHSVHNQTSSKAPLIQLYLNGAVNTSSVRVFVVSNTQLRLVPVTEDVSNLTVVVAIAL